MTGAKILREEHVQKKLAVSFPRRRKWFALYVLSVVQISMNYNASVYGNAIPGLVRGFKVSDDVARMGQWVMLIAYAFGCELWAPWSEDFGRVPVLQASLWMVNIFQVMCGAAPSMSVVIAGRALVGLCSAGGSVTLGVVADMYKPEDQQQAVAFVVFASVMGSVIGPVTGAFIQRYIPNWRWNFWIQLIFGATAAILHLLCPETRSSVLMKKVAKKRRQRGHKVVTVDEVEGDKLTFKKCLTIWTRPFRMFVCEPIVLCLSLLSGFSDALIFMFLEAYGEVYHQWGFGTIAMGLTFVPLAIGYAIAWGLHSWDINRQRDKVANGMAKRGPEEKLRLLLFLAPLEVIGLFGFAWVSLGPSYGVPWIAPMLFSVLVGIANYSIYMATVDYMVEAYGPYAASATGGNGFARDLLAGISALYAKPLYRNIGTRLNTSWPLVYGSLILACLCVLIVSPIYLFFFKGPYIRAHSKFSKKVIAQREETEAKAAARAAENEARKPTLLAR
ncbi:MFS general substrate transporter [Rhizodiscina lignyota]|uniref:MFS general substrate transporter n=1 Tax=Rhizodiscina lignyota TaxID=1504668 RepID=A0A9P4IPJ5_9PEZI|nr:MFS general substrate transporter [Rhizodiscina lignyota]